MRKLILLLALSGITAAQAQVAEKGKPFPPYTLPDQFDQTNTLSRETRYVIITSQMEISGLVNTWLKGKTNDFLSTQRIEYVADITPMPQLITKLFALPKMKKYPFRLLLARDPKFAATYPRQTGRIALFILDESQVVQKIKFLEKPEEIEGFIGARK
jgi:hypothetical protein